MPYTKTTWNEGAAPGISAAELNRMETQYDESVQSYPVGLFDPFVLSGCTAVKNGSIANQLDFTGGTAYPKQTDNTLRKRNPASTTFTTSVASTTYYLDLNPDGTLSWGTAHSAQANYIALYQVTTDASGNILAVTDVAQRQANLLPGLVSAILMLAGIRPVNRAGDTMTGGLTIESSTDGILRLKQTDAGSTAGTKEGGWNYVEFLDGQGDRQGYFGIDNSGNFQFMPEISGAVARVGTSTIWHAGNDGSGSGLDADMLDGQHASAFALASSAVTKITGSYTGDGTASRTINIGATPKMVIVSGGTTPVTYIGLVGNAADHTIRIIGDGNSVTGYKSGGGSPYYLVDITTNGFIVGDSGSFADTSNENGVVFNYTAFI
jgi:hypothetical protein